jgi:nucleoside-diphosphate-sugar epimerase
VDVSIGELVELIGDILGRELEVTLDEARIRPPDSEVQRLLSTPELARELTGWTPAVTLREGLERSIAWVEGNLQRYRTDQYVR